MSLRTALTWTLLATSLAGASVIALLGARSIRAHVVREAQARVDHDLDVLRIEYERRVAAFAGSFQQAVEDARPSSRSRRSPTMSTWPACEPVSTWPW